ncbi:MAG TPA: RNA 2',3'-cyclic phosphodiesterase [Candidatus Acidoferrales bacterium]
MRLFVALDIPEAVREALSALTKRFQGTCAEARWVRLAGAHVTLKFIGEVPAEQVERIRAALGQVRARESIELRFAGLGFFPNARRPRVFWAGVNTREARAAASLEATGSALGRLAADVEKALAPVGIAPEKREFNPHITLARFNSAKRLDTLSAAASKLADSEFGSATATEFHLYRSVLKPTGAEYTRLETYPFSGEQAP